MHKKDSVMHKLLKIADFSEFSNVMRFSILNVFNILGDKTVYL